MMIMRRRLACCTRDREISVDFDEQERIMTYDGLESCIAVDQAYEIESRTSRRDESATGSLDEDNSSCSSSKDAFGSFSSKYMTVKRDQDDSDEWEVLQSPQHFYVKGKPPSYSMQFSDVEIMKEKFAKLLLGEDVTGGCKSITTALALSNAISNLAASVFGELWKLEPLSEERKSNWRLEMNWLLSPTNYMVELVPAKQYGTNGRILEIMTPKARTDVHMNLPALQKLDSMLIETLDAMVSTEFWYAEGGSRAEGRSNSVRHSARWWLPSPRVPTTGLSDKQRKKLICQGKVVHQVFKAARSINENVLVEMPVPTIIRDSLSKAGKPSLGEELYRLLTSESTSVDEMLNSLNLKTEHSALDTINKLESTIFAWKKAITEQASTGKSPIQTSWSFIRDPIFEHHKIELLLDRAQVLLQQVKTRHPNLPLSFLDTTKIQYGKDVGHAILEAYSRVLGNLAFRLLCRIGDILQEDIVNGPSSPVSTCCFPGVTLHGVSDPPIVSTHIRHSLIDHMNSSGNEKSYDLEHGDAKTSSAITTPSRSRVWCFGKEACTNMSPQTSP